VKWELNFYAYIIYAALMFQGVQISSSHCSLLDRKKKKIQVFYYCEQRKAAWLSLPLRVGKRKKRCKKKKKKKKELHRGLVAI
jgi:hypothetical protein